MTTPALRLSCIAAFVLVGCATKPPEAPAVPGCSRIDIANAVQPSQLRSAVRACDGNVKLQVEALDRLNSLPPRPSQMLSLQQAAPTSGSERVTWEVDIFFYALESYPPEEALAKLAQLISRAERIHTIEQLIVTGGSEPSEEVQGNGKLAMARANFVRDYFVKAGLPPSTATSVQVAPASRPTTPEDKAMSRIATVPVVALRAKGA